MTDTEARLDPTPAGATGRGRASVSVLVVPGLSLVCFVVSVWLESGVVGATASSLVSTYPGWATALTGVIFGVCAVVVLRRDPGQGLGWAFAWFGLFWAVDGVAEAYFRLGLATDEALPGMTFTSWFLLRFTALLPATIAIMLAVFPDGHLIEGRWRRAVQVALGAMVAVGPVYIVMPAGSRLGAENLPVGVDPDPTTLHVLDAVEPLLRPATGLVTTLALVVVMAAVVLRYRRSRGLDRERMRWLAWAVTAMALLLVAEQLLGSRQLEILAFYVVVNLGPVAMTIAVTRPQIVAIDDLLSNTLVYGALSLLIVAVDLIVLAALTELIGESLGERQVVLIVLLLSAVLYNPLRVALWGVVRRRVMGQRDDPYDAVSRLASTLEATDDEAAQLTAVAQAVAVAFGVGYVRVEVVREGSEPVVAAYGRPVAETRTLPIAYRGEEVGRLVLPARGVRARLSGRDQRLLGDLVRQAATAARTGRLADQLQENRQRLVVAREEERRRIHHDLHEDLGPTLGGLVHQVETARLLVQERPEEAKETIARTSAQLRDVVADVRRVVHDLRPPALDDLGLLGALRQQATLLGPDRLSVVEHGPGLDRLPAGVEVAAFRIATELLRHAAADESDCELVLSLAESWMSVECGLDTVPDAVAEALRRQATEIGGVCQVSPAGRVSVLLPVRRTA